MDIQEEKSMYEVFIELLAKLLNDYISENKEENLEDQNKG